MSGRRRAGEGQGASPVIRVDDLERRFRRWRRRVALSSCRSSLFPGGRRFYRDIDGHELRRCSLRNLSAPAGAASPDEVAGRWRLSSWSRRMPFRASLTAYRARQREDIGAARDTRLQARDWMVEVLDCLEAEPAGKSSPKPGLSWSRLARRPRGCSRCSHHRSSVKLRGRYDQHRRAGWRALQPIRAWPRSEGRSVSPERSSASERVSETVRTAMRTGVKLASGIRSAWRWNVRGGFLGGWGGPSTSLSANGGVGCLWREAGSASNRSVGMDFTTSLSANGGSAAYSWVCILPPPFALSEVEGQGNPSRPVSDQFAWAAPYSTAGRPSHSVRSSSRDARLRNIKALQPHRRRPGNPGKARP
ncbi:unnamed protein product [Acanthosepion pharaonis]|uniref:Uncharacterized protein n=1 Tax=Acanthosepion pharaonis TaxID=158019 RepID=A0A812DGX2_ACAPH|nr:unnamed protein product [Sepia pharaonis]